MQSHATSETLSPYKSNRKKSNAYTGYNIKLLQKHVNSNIEKIQHVLPENQENIK